MKKKYILAIDQGTTATKVLVLDQDLSVRARATRELAQHFPGPGKVEHDLEEIWQGVVLTLRQALRRGKLRGGEIAAIGITNQRETTALWERKTAAPVGRAIVWQDRRTTSLCESMRREGVEPFLRSRTGLVLDPYFSGTKLAWMFEHLRGARRRAEAGKLAFGTIDSFLIHRLTGGTTHVTDVSNASRTLLMNLHTLEWDEELLRLFRIPEAVLPEIRSSSEVLGTTSGVPGLPDGIPIAGVAGDQQAALFGQACFGQGDSKCTYGTGAFLLTNIGPRPVSSKAGLLTTVGWRLADGQVAYALEGSSFIAGAAVQWLRDGLGIIRSAHEIEALAASVPDSGGVVFVPSLAGLGAPHWRPEARGTIRGLERGTTRAHLARATLEGIAFQIWELADAMASDTGKPIRSFRVDGGAAGNDLLLQIQADLLGRAVIRPHVLDTTSVGAACLAGLATGVWSSPREIARAWREDRRFSPKKGRVWRESMRTSWTEAVAKDC